MNISEHVRLEEERLELIHNIANKYVGKSTKEGWLRELRSIERQLGITGRPYNSSAFGGSDGENLR